jgi:PAS domain-containing protein
VADAVEHGRPFDLELQITTVQGREVWVRKIGVPEVTEGRCRRLYGTFQDIDARMQAEALRLARPAPMRQTVPSRPSFRA